MSVVDTEIELMVKWRSNGISKIYRKGDTILSFNDTVLLEAKFMFCDLLNFNTHSDMSNCKEYISRDIDTLIKRREQVLYRLRKEEETRCSEG